MKPKNIAFFVGLSALSCFGMSRYLFAAADSRGLLPESFAAYFCIVGLILAAALLLGVYLLKHPNRDYRILLPVPVQGIGCLAAAAGCMYSIVSAADRPMFVLLELAGAISFLVLAFYRFANKKPSLIPFAVIGIALLGRCFGQYQSWSRSTQLLEYLFPALSALFLALYSLEFCSMEMREGNCKKAFLFNQVALFCTVACMSSPHWPYYLAMSLWLVSGLFTRPGKMVLPKPVQKCMDRLERNGFTVYAVGGCVRDSILGQTASDYDLCTNATPEEICRVFEGFELVRNGEKHGTIGVVVSGKLYEITTYRTESGYADNRHPDSVEFVDRVEEDLARRDFTVNAMAFHPKTGYKDPYGGQKDLFDGVLRAVGDPQTRFREDSLRILRGVRFACRFRLEVEPETGKAMKELSGLMENLAPERVFGELTQILCAMEQGDLVRFRDVMVEAVPELAPCVGFQQHNPHHVYDVFTHTDRVLARTEKDPALRWAALLHDTAKPQTFTQDASGKGHFYGHAKESAQIANAVMTRLRASNALKEQVVFLVEHHMDTITADKASLRRKLSRYGMENLKKLVNLQLADQGGKRKFARMDPNFEKIFATLDKLEKEEGRLQLRDLAVNGHDLMALGFAAGPELGQCQRELLELVLAGELANEKETLLERAREILNETGGRQDA